MSHIFIAGETVTEHSTFSTKIQYSQLVESLVLSTSTDESEVDNGLTLITTGELNQSKSDHLQSTLLQKNNGSSVLAASFILLKEIDIEVSDLHVPTLLINMTDHDSAELLVSQ